MQKSEVAMKKIVRYEMLYIRFSWMLILYGILFLLISDYFGNVALKGSQNITYYCIFFAIIASTNIYKLYLIKVNRLEDDNRYIRIKLAELLVMVLGVAYLDIDLWCLISALFLVIITGLFIGKRRILVLVTFAIIFHITLLISKEIIRHGLLQIEFFGSEKFFSVVFDYLIFVFFAALCGKIHDDTDENERKNNLLFQQMKEKCEQLAVAQDEIKYHYEKVKTTNEMLETTNKKLAANIAEFYTLQQISRAISSIYDTRELLKHVNDIILGVMGVTYSSIILYDSQVDGFYVHTTNIANEDELSVLTGNVNCDVLRDALLSGKAILENTVDPEKYTFTEGRGVQSLICIPLITKSIAVGLVLIEHTYSHAFDEQNMRLLDIIGQQVGIAMENAELYQRLHDLANTDCLTGVYNRLYLQEQLQSEFKKATIGGYPLSLAILDVDHFKEFNDTYGHLFGDKVIKSIAELLRKSIGSNDLIARYGGEEFVLIFVGIDRKAAFEKVDMIRNKISKLVIKDQSVSTSVTASFGLSCYPQYADSELELIRSADRALYDAKASGRNCVVMASKKGEAI